MECTITFYLDSRRTRVNDVYIVKLRVYVPALAKKKLYATDYELSEKDFEKCFALNPKGKFLEIADALNSLKTKAIAAAKEVEPFTFEKFEKVLYSAPTNKVDVFDCFNLAIEENKSHGRLGNADNYQNSINSIRKFVDSRSKNIVYQSVD